MHLALFCSILVFMVACTGRNVAVLMWGHLTRHFKFKNNVLLQNLWRQLQGIARFYQIAVGLKQTLHCISWIHSRKIKPVLTLVFFLETSLGADGPYTHLSVWSGTCLCPAMRSSIYTQTFWEQLLHSSPNSFLAPSSHHCSLVRSPGTATVLTCSL